MGKTILLSVTMLLVLSAAVTGETRLVPGDYPTIQAAIDNAINGDTIIVAPGIYRGAGNRDIDFKGKAITVRSTDPDDPNIVAATIVDCDGTESNPHSGFFFHNYEGANSILDGLTITNGYAHAYTGGGIDCLRSSPVITNCIITANHANTGGGIFCDYVSSPKLINCTISGNTARNEGGGIYCWMMSSPRLINCTIRGNLSEGNGGGIDSYYQSSLMLSNCIIVGNTAGGKGGGIYLLGNIVMTNCTVAGNSGGSYGGGLFCADDSVIRLTDCIFWGNRDSSGRGQLAQIRGGMADVIYSCIQDADPNDTQIPFSDANGNIDDEPRFVRLPFDLHLRAISPCIDSGLPDFVAGPRTDMDGQPRVMGPRIDMGADEYRTKEIIITIPRGGEIWAAESTHNIEWSSYGAGTVDILYSKDGGGSWEGIKKGISDTGSYSWQVLNKYCSEQAQVKVVPSVVDANVICIASGVFAVQAYTGPASLPQRQKEPGYKPVKQYGPQFGCVKWQFETDGPVTGGVTIGRELGKQRRVYVPCEDGKLYTLDLETGLLIWSYDVNSPLVGSAAEGWQGTVYVGGRDERLYAIDKDGKLLWTHRTDAPIYSAPAVSAQEQIYAGSEDGVLYALRRDGSEVWRFGTGGSGELGGAIFATPVIAADGTIYIGGLYDPNLYAINPDDGCIKWVCNFEHTIQIMYPGPWEPRDVNVAGWPFAQPVVAPDGTIYMGLLFDTYLFAIEPEGGSIRWSTNLSGLMLFYSSNYIIWYGVGNPPEYVEVDGQMRLVRWVIPYRYGYCWSKPALGPDGTVYVSFDDAYLRAVDPNGSIKWFSKLGELGGFTLTVGDDGLIYAASDDNRLYVVEPDGEEIGRFEGEGWLSQPVIAPGRTIIVSDANNTVWAITQEGCGDKPIVLDVQTEPNEP